jgi:hypothetical protein
MPAFPRHSIAWQLEHKTTWRRVSLSLPWYGFGTGVVLRMYRWFVLALLVPDGWAMLLGLIAGGVVLLCALSAGHLANFTLKSWRWRAPALGVFVALGEAVTSFGLTLVHQERMGRSIATMADWPSAALNALVTRVLIVSVFALVLSIMVLALRKVEAETDIL